MFDSLTSKKAFYYLENEYLIQIDLAGSYF